MRAPLNRTAPSPRVPPSPRGATRVCAMSQLYRVVVRRLGPVRRTDDVLEYKVSAYNSHNSCRAEHTG